MATTLKSRSGCLTCLTRKKKCDETSPQCSHCKRLGLACISRSAPSKASVSNTNLRSNGSSLSPALSNGYPAFGSPLEQKLCLGSPHVLDILVSEDIADKSFKNVGLLGRFCTQSRLVRGAVVAFAAYGLQDLGDDYYKLSLKSYQRCVSALQTSRAYECQDTKESHFAIVAIMFLGLLEALALGDPRASVAHFEMCRKLLTARLKHAAALQDAERVKLYRMAAECIIYNFASLSPFHEAIGRAASDWGASFQSLFPTNHHSISPFLGGVDFQDIYQIMFSMNVLLDHTQANPDLTSRNSDNFSYLWQRLDAQERKATMLYSGRSKSAMARLYRAKYRISIQALRIHLIKISRPTATTADMTVRLYLSKAITTMKEQEICEAWNPALRWPLTILACAAQNESDFALIMSTMDKMMENLDHANSRRLRSAQAILRRFRQKHNDSPSLAAGYREHRPNQLDILLEPRTLDKFQPRALSA